MIRLAALELVVSKFEVKTFYQKYQVFKKIILSSGHVINDKY